MNDITVASSALTAALEAAQSAGVPVWHHHVPDKILRAITTCDLDSVVSYSERCRAIMAAYLRTAVDVESGDTRDSDGLTAEQNLSCALYFEALGEVCSSWIRMSLAARAA